MVDLSEIIDKVREEHSAADQNTLNSRVLIIDGL